MDIIRLAQSVGLNPKWVAGTNGGEYATFCPVCGGNDRLRLWPNKKMNNCMGSYWCRKCEIHGDIIEFCKKYHCGSFEDAVKCTGAFVPDNKMSVLYKKKENNKFVPSKIEALNDKWMSKANIFIEESHKQIWQQANILSYLNRRGVSEEIIKQNKLGYNPSDIYQDKTEWGLIEEDKKLWLPAGIVIPTADPQGNIIRIKIRRDNWSEGDQYSKYIVISGSQQGLNIFGITKDKNVMVVVESELDAMVMSFEIRNFGFAIAVGSALKNPDILVDSLAKKTPYLLICHDNDESGKKMFEKWKTFYSNSQACPTPVCKDIGEAIQQGFDIRDWLLKTLVKFWDKEDQDLIYWYLDYVHKSRKKHNTNEIFVNTEKEIMSGPNSPRAKTRELQNGLKLVKDTLDEYLKKNS